MSTPVKITLIALLLIGLGVGFYFYNRYKNKQAAAALAAANAAAAAAYTTLQGTVQIVTALPPVPTNSGPPVIPTKSLAAPTGVPILTPQAVSSGTAG